MADLDPGQGKAEGARGIFYTQPSLSIEAHGGVRHAEIAIRCGQYAEQKLKPDRQPETQRVEYASQDDSVRY